MRSTVVLYVAAGLLAMTQLASAAQRGFTPDDIEVCPTSAGVLDPEFDDTSQRMTFADWQYNLKVLTLNPDGTSSSPNCVGTLIDTNTTLSMKGFPLKNGPEWGRSQNGAEIFYTKLNANNQPMLARAWQVSGVWHTQALPNGLNRGLPLASTDDTDSEPRIIYPHTFPGTGKPWQYLWREADDASTEAQFPASIVQSVGSAPRWVQGQRAITTTQPDANGVQQAIEYWIDTGEIDVLTADSGQKDEVWMWPAPELGGEMIFMAMADDCCLRIYRQVSGVWTVVNEIDASSFSTWPTIYSPQPFTYKGRSYVSMQLSAEKYGPGEIWIASVDPQYPLLRKVSDDNTVSKVRTEPEAMTTSEGVFVYYSMVVAQGKNWTLRRCATGL